MKGETPKKSKKKVLPYAVLASLVFSNIAMPYVQIGGVEFGTNVASAATNVVPEQLTTGQIVQIGNIKFYSLNGGRLVSISSIGQRRFDAKYSGWSDNPKRSDGDTRSELNKYLNEEWRFTALGEDGTKQSPIKGEVDLLTRFEYDKYRGSQILPQSGDGKSYWLKDSQGDESAYVILTNGNVDYFNVARTEYDVRPAVTLKQGITLTGSGTLTDPYKPVVGTNNKPTLAITSDLNPKVAVGQELVIIGTANDIDNDPMIVSTTIGGYTARASITNGGWKLKIPAYAVAEGQYPNVNVTLRDENGSTSVASLGTVSIGYTKTITPDELRHKEVVQIGNTKFYSIDGERLVAISPIGQRRFDAKYSGWGDNPKRSGGDTRSELNKYLNEEWRFTALGEDGTKQSPIKGEVDLLTRFEYEKYRGSQILPQDGDGKSYWLKDGQGEEQAYVILTNGNVDYFNVARTEYDVRPAVTLKLQTELTGSGTLADPYKPVLSANNKPTLTVTSDLNPKVAVGQELVIIGTADDKDNDSMVVSTTIGGYTARSIITNGGWRLKIPAYAVAEGQYPNVNVTLRDESGSTSVVNLGTVSIGYTKTITPDELRHKEVVQIGNTKFYSIDGERLVAISPIGQRRFDEKYSGWSENPKRFGGDTRSELNKYLNEEWRFTALGEDGTKQSPIKGEVDLLTRFEYEKYRGSQILPQNGDGKQYWLKDGQGEEQAYVILTNGNVDYFNVARTEYDVRPAVTLKLQTELTGSGTLTDPYKPVLSANNKPTLTVTSDLNPKVSVGQELIITGTANDKDNDPMVVSASIGRYAVRTSTVNGTWTMKIPAHAIPEGQYPNVNVILRDIHGGTDIVNLGTVSIGYNRTITSDKLLYKEVVQLGNIKFYSLGGGRLFAVSNLPDANRRFDSSYSVWGIDPRRTTTDKRAELNAYLNTTWKTSALGTDISSLQGDVDLLTKAESETLVAKGFTFEGNYFWLNTPYNENSVWVYRPQYSMDWYSVGSTNAVRPAVTLKAGIPLIGSGTMGDPYRLNSSMQTVLTLDGSDAMQYASRNSTKKTITLKGTVQDASNSTVTISATIAGKTKTTTVTGTNTIKNWTLTWDVNSDSISDNKYTGIEVTVNDGKGGTRSIIYGGTMIVDSSKPNVSIDGIRSGEKYTSVTPSITAGDQGSGLKELTATLDGNPYQIGTPIVASGNHTLVATATDNAGNQSSQTVTFTIEKSAEGILLDKNSLTIPVGKTDMINATVYPEDASNKTLVFNSDNTNIATVDATGKVTAKGTGTTTITVTTPDGSKKAYCTVIVVNAVTGITLDKASLDFTGTTSPSQKLTATVTPANATDKTVIWTSSDENIAMVDSSGNVTPKGIGTATITAKTRDGNFTASASVTVASKSVSDVSINPSTLTLTSIGATQQLIPVITPADATNTNVTWKSSNPSVATIDENGKVTAVGIGTATIVLTTADGGKTANCVVEVKIPVQDMTLDKTELSFNNIGAGYAQKINAFVWPSNATNKKVLWTSSDSRVATVDNNGNVTPVGIGSAVITAKTEDGEKTAHANVIVNAVLPDQIETTPVETTKNKVKFSFKTVSGMHAYQISSPNGIYTYTRDQSNPSKFNVVLDSSQKVASLAGTKLFTPRVLSTESMPPVYMDSDGWVPFEDKGLEPETKYDYTVTAQDSSGKTGGNTPIEATTQPPTYIYLSWPPHPDAVKYRIKRNGETVWEGTETRGKDVITQDDMDVSSFEYTMWGVRSDGTEFELPMFEIIEKPYIDVGETHELDLLVQPEETLKPVLRTEAGEEIPNATYSYAVKSGGQFISVDQNGKVRGLAVGEGVVTISSVAGDKTFTKDVTFKVIDTSDEIDSVTASVDNDKLSLLSDPTEQIKVEVKNKAGKVLTGLPITYTITQGTEAVSVDKNGLITAKAVGSATITVECAGKKANVNVTVQDLSSFSLNVDRTTLNLRDAKTSKINVILKDMDGNEIPNPKATYKVASGSDVVSVDQNGLVTAKAIGSALVEVTVGNETQSVAYVVEDLGSISVSAKNTSLNLTDHQTEQLVVEVKDEAGNIVTNPKVTYGINSGSGIVTVDATGLVRAIAKGTSVIEVRYGSKTATISFTVEVEEPPVEEDLSEITVRANNPSLNLTDHTTEQLIVEVKDAKGNVIENPVVNYKVESGTEVVSVDAQGLVKAKAEGTATIVVSSGKKSARITMTVNQPDLSAFTLKADNTTLNLTDNTTAHLVPELKDSAGNIITNPPVLYTIKSGSGVVSVDKNGLVTAKAVGTAIIEGSSGGKTASVTFTVQPPSDQSSISVKAMNPSLNLTDHKTEQLFVEVKDKAGNVIFNPDVTFTVVSGADVLSVDQNGLVTAKAVGTATVQAESNGMRGTVSLTVSEPPVVDKSSISVSADNPTLDLVKHKTEQIKVVVNDKTGAVVPNPKITYTVKSGEEVVSVDANGLVTAKAVGSAVIEATSGGLSGTVTFNVQPQPPTKIEIKLKWKAVSNLLYYRVTRNDEEIYKGKNNYCVDYVQPGSVNDYKIYAHRLDGTTVVIDPDIEDKDGQKLNINLSNLLLSKGTLIAPFNKTITDYSATVGPDVQAISLTPTVEDKSSTIEINGTVAEDGVVSRPIPLSDGVNEIAVDVISKDQKLRKRYTVNVLRQDGIPVTGIRLDKDKLLFDLNNPAKPNEGIGSVKRLNAIVMPDNASYKDVIWSTGNKAVATVDQNGNVTATGKGTTTITARTVDGNKTATATVNVGEGPILTYKSALNFSVKKDQWYTLAGAVVGEGPITVYVQYGDNQPVKLSEAVDSFPFSQFIKFDGSKLIAPNGIVAEGLSPGQTVTLKLWAEDSFGRKSRLADK